MRRREFRVDFSPFVGYYVSEVHEGGFTSQVGRSYLKRQSAERHLGVVLRNHRPKFVPTYATMKENDAKRS